MRTLRPQKHGISLHDFFPESVKFGSDISACSCTDQADAVRPEDAFFAIEHLDHDGHELAERAVERGASALVVERLLPLFAVPQILVPDTRMAYGRFCQKLVGNPCEQMSAVGILETGSESSQVVPIVRSILRVAGFRSGLLSRTLVCEGAEVYQPTHDPLTPIGSARALAEMVASDCSHALVELRSEMLKQHHHAGLSFDMVCIPLQKSEAKSEKTSKLLKKLTTSLTKDSVLLMNAEDADSIKACRTLKKEMVTFGMSSEADISARLLTEDNCEQEFLLRAGRESVVVGSKIIGETHRYDCLAAAAISRMYGVSLTDIAQGIERATSQLVLTTPATEPTKPTLKIYNPFPSNHVEASSLDE